jgi:Skp family chaperone for outer membrane proteins
MSSKKEKDKEFTEALDTTLDETKSSVNKTTNEARKEVPQFAKAVNEYQEETIEASKDIADNYLESQKEVIHSMQSYWIPYIENIQNS